MTESEYIRLTNLTKIRTVIRILRDIFPDENHGPSVIRLGNTLEEIYKWEDDLSKNEFIEHVNDLGMRETNDGQLA